MKTEKKSTEKKDWEKIEVELKKSLEKKKLQNPLTETIKKSCWFPSKKRNKTWWWETYDRKEKLMMS